MLFFYWDRYIENEWQIIHSMLVRLEIKLFFILLHFIANHEIHIVLVERMRLNKATLQESTLYNNRFEDGKLSISWYAPFSLAWFALNHTTTKRSFYIGWKQVSMTSPTPSLFQMSLYVDNNDIDHPRTRLCNVRIQRQCVYNNRRYIKRFDDAHIEEPVVVGVHFNVGYA